MPGEAPPVRPESPPPSRVDYPFLASYVSQRLNKSIPTWVGCVSLLGTLVGVVLIFAPHGRGVPGLGWTALGVAFLYSGSIAKWIRKQQLLAEFARSSPEVQINARTQAFCKTLSTKLPMNKGTRLLPAEVLQKLESISRLGASVAGRAVGQEAIRAELAKEAGAESFRLRDHGIGVASGARRRFAFLEFFPTEPSHEQIQECLALLEPVAACLQSLLDALSEFEPEPAKQVLETAQQLRAVQRHYVYNVLPPPN